VLHPTLNNYFKKYSLDTILITNLLNVRYLTGFTGTNGLVLLTRKKQFFFTDSRYTEQAKREVKNYIVVQIKQDLLISVSERLSAQGGSASGGKDYKIIPPRAGSRLGGKRLGFDAGTVSYNQYLRLKKKLKGIALVPITEDPAEMRIIKSKDEIKKLEKALQINKLAFNEIRRYIKPGVREIDIAFKLEFALRKHGAEKLAFDTIVASGIRGAMPHGKASEKKIKAGELVTIDFGGVYQGYHADETVTLLVTSKSHPTLPSAEGRGWLRPSSAEEGIEGRSRKQLEIYHIVLEAQRLATKKVRPGVKCSDIDKAARDYITKKGYGKYFGHALGHGVGLEVHERPVLSPTSKDVLQEGMVFTIEPGIYIPGWGGVRLEDVFVCTKSGFKKLTKINKQI